MRFDGKGIAAEQASPHPVVHHGGDGVRGVVRFAMADPPALSVDSNEHAKKSRKNPRFSDELRPQFGGCFPCPRHRLCVHFLFAPVLSDTTQFHRRRRRS